MTDDAAIRISAGSDPIAALRRAHVDQMALCDQLEEIADSLPGAVNRQKCIYAARALGPMVRGLHRFEEDVVFPLLERRLNGNPDLAATLERLRFEHCEDECYAEELSEALHDLGVGKDGVNVEAIAYMLRGFFEAMRRHIAFERDHLLSAAY